MFRHHADRPDPAVQAARAEADALLGRLGHDVSTLDDGGDATNRQALADAAERYNTAGAQLGQASSLGEIAVVRSIAIEGLHSTRLVRTRLGLDPGPEPAEAPAVPPPAPAPQRPAWGSGRPAGSGLGGALGAGIAGGLLGMLGGEVLGDVFDGDGGGGGGWGGDNDGGWGGDNDGGW